MQININKVDHFEAISISKWFLPVVVSVVVHVLLLMGFAQNDSNHQTFAMQSHKTAFSIASMKPITSPQKASIQNTQKKLHKGVTQKQSKPDEVKHETKNSIPVFSMNEIGQINVMPHYPVRAIENGWQGKSVLLVKIVNGITSEIVVEKTSGYNILDNSAINAIKKIKTPKNIALSEYWIRIPVDFIIS